MPKQPPLGPKLLDAKPPLRPAASLPRRFDGSPLKVLVVEDEALIAIDLEQRLREWEAEPYVAQNVRDALRLASEVRPDLVLMDVQLPDGDGVLTAAKLKEIHGAPIVFVTASTDAVTLERIRQLGDHDVMRKPPNFPLLHQAIHRALERTGTPRS